MRKQTVFAASSAGAGIVLAVALVGMLNWIGYRHYARSDWTSSKLYTLSEKSKNVLKGIATDVRVVVLMTPSTPLFSETKELLDRYKAASPKIQVEYIDPERDPLRTKTLAQEFGVSVCEHRRVRGRRPQEVRDVGATRDYDYSGMQMGQAPR